MVEKHTVETLCGAVGVGRGGELDDAAALGQDLVASGSGHQSHLLHAGRLREVRSQTSLSGLPRKTVHVQLTSG